MDVKTSLFIANIALLLPFVLTQKSYRVDLQSSGIWSKDETIIFNGQIPNLKELTSCHWERNTYFAKDITNVWSYCFSESIGEENKKCIQLHHQGDRWVANRDVIFSGYFYGWTATPININFEVKGFKHRTWNHFCWTYSALKGDSSLFYNGNLVANVDLSYETVQPTILGTEEVNKHLFVIGQEPDTLKGDYSEDQALFGSISEFNLWYL